MPLPETEIIALLARLGVDEVRALAPVAGGFDESRHPDSNRGPLHYE